MTFMYFRKNKNWQCGGVPAIFDMQALKHSNNDMTD